MNVYPYSYPTGSGYNCPTCGSWVTYGHWHSCSPTFFPTTNWVWEQTEERDEFVNWPIVDAAEAVRRVVENES